MPPSHIPHPLYTLIPSCTLLHPYPLLFSLPPHSYNSMHAMHPLPTTMGVRISHQSPILHISLTQLVSLFLHPHPLAPQPLYISSTHGSPIHCTFSPLSASGIPRGYFSYKWPHSTPPEFLASPPHIRPWMVVVWVTEKNARVEHPSYNRGEP